MNRRERIVMRLETARRALTPGQRLIVVLVYTWGASMAAGAMAVVVLTSYTSDVSTAVAVMFGVFVALLTAILFVLALLLAAVWGFRP